MTYAPEPADGDIVNLRQIADILGYSDQVIYSYRRRGSFNLRPLPSEDRRSVFYLWSDVSDWARHRSGQGYRRDIYEGDTAVERGQMSEDMSKKATRGGVKGRALVVAKIVEAEVSRRGLNQTWLVGATGLDKGTVSRRVDRFHPWTINDLDALARRLNVSVLYLMGLEQ